MAEEFYLNVVGYKDSEPIRRSVRTLVLSERSGI
ncbi:Protein of unknown function [Bacillus cytotoxicus]|uniref:Uncharacterized protein n=1 Tax=Bacillus cytotoxicus TaxID=580165 RepID=A0AAX2CHL5_9BACI|nr:Protein of unknown function [Bacillus cytotoxicus]